jgi:hypothetical protein
MQRPGPRTFLLAIAVRITLVLPFVAGWPGIGAEAQARPVAAVIPQHLDGATKAYVRLGPDLLAALTGEGEARLPASARLFAPAIREMLIDAAIRPEDLASWLGSEAALAIVDADPGTLARRAKERRESARKAAARAGRNTASGQTADADPGPAPGDDSEVLGILTSRDDARASAFLSRFATSHKCAPVRASVRGLTAYRTGTGDRGAYFAAGRGIVAFSSSKPLLESVFGRKPRRSLADNGEFRNLMGKLPSGGLVELYISPRIVTSLTKARTARAAGPLGVSKIFSRLYGWKGLAGSLRAEDSGLGFEMLTHNDPKAVAEFANAPPLTQATLDGVGAKALGFMAFNLRRGFWDGIMSEMGESLEALRGSDIDLARDLFSWLEGDVSLVVVPVGATGGNFPVGAYFSVETKQVTAAAAGMRKLAKFAAEMLGPEVVFEVRTISDKDWTLVKSAESGPALGGYAIDRAGLRLALGQAGIEEAASHSTITSATSYRAVIAHLPARSTYLLYFDVAGTLEVVRQLLKPAERKAFDQEIGPLLGSLDALAVSGAYPLVDKDGLMRMSAFLTVKP